MSTVAQSPSHHGKIAELFILDAAMLCTTLLRSVRSCYDTATTNALPQRLCYLSTANLDASTTLPLHSWHSGQFKALFKCSPKGGVALLNSRTNSVRAVPFSCY